MDEGNYLTLLETITKKILEKCEKRGIYYSIE